MSTFLIIVGMVLYVIGAIWLIIKAFQESILWGLGSLVIPLVGLIFGLIHWAECKKPFLYALAGALLMIIGAAVSPHNGLAMPAPVQ